MLKGTDFFKVFDTQSMDLTDKKKKAISGF